MNENTDGLVASAEETAREAALTEVAVSWYGKAAEQGHADAQFLLADFYEEGRGGLSKDGLQERMGARVGKAQAEGALTARRDRAVDGLEGVCRSECPSGAVFDNVDTPYSVIAWPASEPRLRLRCRAMTLSGSC